MTTALARSRRSTDPYWCSTAQRLRWYATAPVALASYALILFVLAAVAAGYLLAAGPLQRRVEVPVPGPTITITAPAAPTPGTRATRR